MEFPYQERLSRLRLIRSENIGPATFTYLINRAGSAEKALERLPEIAKRAGRRRPLKICSPGQAKREYENLKEKGGEWLFLGEADYPELLSHIADPPPVLAIFGQASLLSRKVLAIVGTRNASSNGLHFTEMITKEIINNDYAVVSGMARGIDRAAGMAALEEASIAVLAGGVDVIYPQENTDLYEKLCEVGAIISEMPLGVQPGARLFPRRNRLISGLALATIVVEANLRSGSIMTAKFAGEQGREVFAVPGSPLDGRAQGTNALIADGAHILRSAQDIFNILGSKNTLAEIGAEFSKEIIAEPDRNEIAACREVLDEYILYTPTPIDQLISQSGFSAGIVQSLLVEMEIAGNIERQPGNYITRLA